MKLPKSFDKNITGNNSGLIIFWVYHKLQVVESDPFFKLLRTTFLN